MTTNSHPAQVETLAASIQDGSVLPLYSSVAAGSDITISEYLARPYLMYTYTGSGSIAFTEESFLHDFLTTYYTVGNKLLGFALLRGSFKLDFQLTVNPYAYGQFIIARYMQPFSTINLDTTDSQGVACTLSTMHHVILDCSTNNMASLIIPLTTLHPYISISQVFNGFDISANLFRFAVSNVTPIVSAFDGSNSAYTLKIFGSIIDSEITIPSATNTSEAVSTIDHPLKLTQSIKVVSEHVRKSLKLGAFALSSGLIDTAFATAALMAGFSRPKNMDNYNYSHEENYTDAEGALRIKTLTLDPLQEVPVVATNLGEDGEDNLSHSKLITRAGILGNFVWQTSNAAGTTLFTIPVVPNLAYQSGSGGYFAPSPLAYVSQLYSVWRGSIVYKISIPLNRYCRGKLRFYWLDYSISGLPTQQGITQNAPSVVLDVSTDTEVTIEIPWGIQQQYLPIDNMIPIGASASYYPNGTFYCMVEQELIMPVTSVGAVDLIVWISGNQDTHFFLPDIRKIQKYYRQVYNGGWATTQNLAWLSEAEPTIPSNSSGYSPDQFTISYGTNTSAMIPYPNQPVQKTTHLLFPKTNCDLVNLNQMGEFYDSLRPLCKRFYPYMQIENVSPSDTAYYKYFVPAQLMEPYITNVSSQYYIPRTMMTPPKYISNMFAGTRGSTRFRIDPTGMFNNTDFKWTVTKTFMNPYTYSVTNQIPWRWLRSMAGQGGASWNIKDEPIMWEFPFQNVFTFILGNPSVSTYAGGQQIGSAIEFLTVNNAGTMFFELYASVGEDWTPVIWNGCPQITPATVVPST